MARRASEIRRTGWPGWLRVAIEPSGRTRSMAPLLRSSRTLTMPVPVRDLARRTGQRRVRASQPASRSVDGESDAPVTVASVTASNGGWSRAAASRPRHSVTRVQARSVSPLV